MRRSDRIAMEVKLNAEHQVCKEESSHRQGENRG